MSKSLIVIASLVMAFNTTPIYSIGINLDNMGIFVGDDDDDENEVCQCANGSFSIYCCEGYDSSDDYDNNTYIIDEYGGGYGDGYGGDYGHNNGRHSGGQVARGAHVTSGSSTHAIRGGASVQSSGSAHATSGAAHATSGAAHATSGGGHKHP